MSKTPSTKKICLLFGAGAEIDYGMPIGADFSLEIFNQLFAVESRKAKEEVAKAFQYKLQHAQDLSLKEYADWLPRNNSRVYFFDRTLLKDLAQDTLVHRYADLNTKLVNIDVAYHEELKQLQDKALSLGAVLDGTESEAGTGVGTDADSQEPPEYSSTAAAEIFLQSQTFNQLLDFYELQAQALDRCEKEGMQQNIDSTEQAASPNSPANTISYLQFCNDSKDLELLANLLKALVLLCLGNSCTERVKTLNQELLPSRLTAKSSIFCDLGNLYYVDYAQVASDSFNLLFAKPSYGMEDPNASAVCRAVWIAQKILKNLLKSALDYRSVIDSYWHYLYTPKDDWAKFSKTVTFLMLVKNYIQTKVERNFSRNQAFGYYHVFRHMAATGMIDLTSVSTTNYGKPIQEIFGELLPQLEVVYLNGSTELEYDPYLNQSFELGPSSTEDGQLGHKPDSPLDGSLDSPVDAPVGSQCSINSKCGSSSKCRSKAWHFTVPLMFTQNGTKPMTSSAMLESYYKTYQHWKEADCIVVVGFGFTSCDDNINSMLRECIEGGTKLIVVTMITGKDKGKITEQTFCHKLKMPEDYAGSIKLIDVGKLLPKLQEQLKAQQRGDVFKALKEEYPREYIQALQEQVLHDIDDLGFAQRAGENGTDQG